MVAHTYLFRRPRALQYNRYTRAGRQIRTIRSHSTIDAHGVELLPISRDPSPHKSRSRDRSRSMEPARHTLVIESSTLQRSHLDLFIDLIYVGIVGNLSEHFSYVIFSPPKDGATPTGDDVFYALLEFQLLFLLMWRIWNLLRNFTNMFFLDDILQRIFIMWILMLTVVMGNTSPWAFENRQGAETIIALYLVIRLSFLLMEGFYITFNTFLWKEYLATMILALPAAGFWIAAMFTSDWTLYGLVIAAMIVEYASAGVLNHPIADRLLAVGYRKTLDLEHYVERVGAFFTIILGEGVLLLIKSSPLGEGVSASAGVGCAALAVYFCVHMFYFKGNHNSESIETIRNATWKLLLWQLCHLLLFSALLLLEIANLFIVQHIEATADDPPELPEIDDDFEDKLKRSLVARAASAPGASEDLTPTELAHFMRVALWTGSTAMACVIFSLTCLHLLNSSEMTTRGRVIDNVFVRLLPRILLIIIFPCLPLTPHLTGADWMGIVVGCVYVVILWELVSGLGEDSMIFEPEEGPVGTLSRRQSLQMDAH